jgi:predicted RNase H-like HicB family nuclease
MKREFNVIIERGEDGYLISEVIGLSGCHSQAKSYDELIKRTKEAITLYLNCQDKTSLPLADSFLAVQKLTV